MPRKDHPYEGDSMMRIKDLENNSLFQSTETVSVDLLKGLRFKNLPVIIGEFGLGKNQMGEIVGMIPGTNYCLLLLYEEKATDSPNKYCIVRIDELSNHEPFFTAENTPAGTAINNVII